MEKPHDTVTSQLCKSATPYRLVETDRAMPGVRYPWYSDFTATQPRYPCQACELLLATPFVYGWFFHVKYAPKLSARGAACMHAGTTYGRGSGSSAC